MFRTQTMLVGNKKVNGEVPFVVMDGIMILPSPDYYRARLEAYKAADAKKGIFGFLKRK